MCVKYEYAMWERGERLEVDCVRSDGFDCRVFVACFLFGVRGENMTLFLFVCALFHLGGRRGMMI